MTPEQIVKLLKDPPKPDIANFKTAISVDEVMRDFLNIPVSKLDALREIGSSMAVASVEARLDPDHITRLDRESLYRHLDRGWSDETKDYQEAIVKVWKKHLKAKKGKMRRWNGDMDRKQMRRVMKMKPEDFDFSIRINLGYRRSGSGGRELFDSNASPWDERNGLFPDVFSTGIPKDFMDGLRTDIPMCRFLALHGFMNVVHTKERIYLVKMPKRVSLELVRGRWMMSDTSGPARISAGGMEKYWVRGVEFNEKDYSDLVINRKPAKHILSLFNTEQRRVLLELKKPEEILAECDAKLVDQSDKGNRLYEIDMGIQTRGERNPETFNWERKPRPAKMLVYECPSTGRVYNKFVPFEMTKADEAQAWSHNMPLERYMALSNQS